MSEAVESSLIVRAAAGDAAAFGQLVKLHQSRVRGFLRRILGGDAALADDLAQESFIRAWRKIAQYRGDGAFEAWLIRIAWFTLLQNRRRKDVRPLWREEEEGSFSSHAASDARMDLEKLLPHLSAEERAALTLGHALGYSQDEIAKMMGLPLGTVKSHMTRGRTKLRKLLGLTDKETEHDHAA